MFTPECGPCLSPPRHQTHLVPRRLRRDTVAERSKARGQLVRKLAKAKLTQGEGSAVLLARAQGK